MGLSQAKNLKSNWPIADYITICNKKANPILILQVISPSFISDSYESLDNFTKYECGETINFCEKLKNHSLNSERNKKFKRVIKLEKSDITMIKISRLVEFIYIYDYIYDPTGKLTSSALEDPIMKIKNCHLLRSKASIEII